MLIIGLYLILWDLNQEILKLINYIEIYFLRLNKIIIYPHFKSNAKTLIIQLDNNNINILV